MMKEPLSPLPITDEEANLFTTGWGLTGFNTLGYTMGDVTMTPDYPRAAQLASDMQKAIVGDDIDGVFAVDPVFLQYMLGIVGSTQLPDGTVVDGSNAAKVLLHDIYWNYPVEEQDAIFAAVAGSAFNKIVDELAPAILLRSLPPSKRVLPRVASSCIRETMTRKRPRRLLEYRVPSKPIRRRLRSWASM